MKQFFMSLGVVGPALAICFQLWLYTSIFAVIFIWRNKRGDVPGETGSEEVMSEEGVMQLSKEQVPWNAVTILHLMEEVPVSLGLLGTGIGLLTVFSKLEVGNAAGSINAILKGFGQALSTTVSGLVVSVAAMVTVTVVKKSFMNIARGVIKNENSMFNTVHRCLRDPGGEHSDASGCPESRNERLQKKGAVQERETATGEVQAAF